MNLDDNEIMSILRTFAEKEGLLVQVNESITGGILTGGASAVIGGILFGPIGLAIGELYVYASSIINLLL